MPRSRSCMAAWGQVSVVPVVSKPCGGSIHLVAHLRDDVLAEQRSFHARSEFAAEGVDVRRRKLRGWFALLDPSEDIGRCSMGADLSGVEGRSAGPTDPVRSGELSDDVKSVEIAAPVQVDLYSAIVVLCTERDLDGRRGQVDAA